MLMHAVAVATWHGVLFLELLVCGGQTLRLGPLSRTPDTRWFLLGRHCAAVFLFQGRERWPDLVSGPLALALRPPSGCFSGKLLSLQATLPLLLCWSLCAGSPNCLGELGPRASVRSQPPEPPTGATPGVPLAQLQV